jgi:hypothetical protein
MMMGLAISFIPIVGDVIDVASAVAGQDLLTGEEIKGVGVAATVVGTIFGSGKLAREAAKHIDDAVGLGGKAADGAGDAADAGTEVVQRAMATAELRATESSGLLRGGREGTHHVSNAVNSDAGRARQRLALAQTPEVRVTLQVPAGRFTPASRVQPNFDMPGGGMQRTATGPVPVRILRVDEY